MPSLTASAQRRIVRFIVRNSGACRRYERIPNAPTSPQHRDVPCPFSEIGSVTTTRPRPHRPFLSRRHRPVQRRGRHRHAVPAEPHAPAGRRDPSPLPGPGHQNRRALAAVRQARLHVHGDDRTASGTRVARGRRFRRVNRRRSSARGATGRRDPGRGREAHRVQGARGLPQEERAGQGARDGPESRRLGRRGRSRGVHRHRQNVARRTATRSDLARFVGCASSRGRSSGPRGTEARASGSRREPRRRIKPKTKPPRPPRAKTIGTGCAPAFSAFDVVSAYEHVGLRGVPLAFARTARAVLQLNEGIESVRRVCASRHEAGGVLCGLRPSLGCDPRGCDAKLDVAARACVVGNGLVEMCDWIRSAAPTEEEVKTVAWADFRQSTSSQDEGCEKGSFDPASAASAIKFGAVAARWSERSGGALEMAALAAPWVSSRIDASERLARTGDDDDARARTEVTRLAFRLAPRGTPGYAAATRWAKEVAGPIVESWGNGEMTASWRHMWALKLMDASTSGEI